LECEIIGKTCDLVRNDKNDVIGIANESNVVAEYGKFSKQVCLGDDELTP